MQKCKYRFVGRKDSIIKRFGHRVCLSQIERLVSSFNYMKWCSCLFDDTYGLVLFAYISDDVNLMNDRYYQNELRSLLQLQLTSASVPDQIILVDRIYLNSHGNGLLLLFSPE